MNPIALLTQRFGREPEGNYECKGCATRYRTEYHVCPVCESFSVEARRQTWSDDSHDEQQTG